jgi:hypothetical protein
MVAAQPAWLFAALDVNFTVRLPVAVDAVMVPGLVFPEYVPIKVEAVFGPSYM